MSCRERQEFISAYIDGEVTDSVRRELEAHLAACAPCTERVASLRSLKRSVSKLDGRVRPPEAVLARVEALRFGLRRPRSRMVRGAVVVLTAAATITLAFIAGRAWIVGDSTPSLADELIADHLKYAPEAMPGEVASNEPDHVQRFFEGKVPFEPVVPSLEGANLIGGRLCRIRGYYVQLLFYERDGRKLSLYVSNRPETSSACDSRGGYNVCRHRRGVLSLMLVGDAPRGELRTLLDNAGLKRVEDDLSQRSSEGANNCSREDLG